MNPTRREVLQMREGEFFKKWNKRVENFELIGIRFPPATVARILRECGKLLKKAHGIMEEK